MTPIYLDYNATTPLDPAVVDAIVPYLREHFGNPSSTHAYGVKTHAAVDESRAQVAALMSAQPDEIIFTGGGSEASNHALKGAVFQKLGGWFGRWVRGAHIVTTAIEHPATLQPCAFLKRLGCSVTILPVDRQGVVDLAAAKKAIVKGTTIVSVMHSNNEVGTLQPIRELADLAHRVGALMHTDAAQSLGKVLVNVNELGVDLLSLAGHKLYAPKGIGVLYVRRGVKLEPFIHGAGHESGRRAGTENVPYIAGLGKACAIARQHLPQATERLRLLRDRLWDGLKAGLGDRVLLNGPVEERLPNTLNMNFLDHVGADLLQKTPEIAASTGSACHEGQINQSPVLCAMGVPPEIGKGAIRLSVGRFTTEEEIDRAVAILVARAQNQVMSAPA